MRKHLQKRCVNNNKDEDSRPIVELWKDFIGEDEKTFREMLC